MDLVVNREWDWKAINAEQGGKKTVNNCACGNYSSQKSNVNQPTVENDDEDTDMILSRQPRQW